MKKIFFVCALILSSANVFGDAVKNYNLVNHCYESLSKSLNLDDVTSKDFKVVYDTFKNQLDNIDEEKNDSIKKIMLINAYKQNYWLSRQILNDKEKHNKYITILKNTINNRINKNN